jgi:predicted membrane protein
MPFTYITPLMQLVLAFIVVVLVAWLINRFATLPRDIRIALNIVLALIAVGMGLWLINTYVPMAASIRAILNIFVVLATCVGVLQALGLWDRTIDGWRNFRNRHVS